MHQSFRWIWGRIPILSYQACWENHVNSRCVQEHKMGTYLVSIFNSSSLYQIIWPYLPSAYLSWKTSLRLLTPQKGEPCTKNIFVAKTWSSGTGFSFKITVFWDIVPCRPYMNWWWWWLLYDLRSVSQYILVSSTLVGLENMLLPVGMLLSEICGLVSVGRPLWRQDGSAICGLIT
jgi:hypothetical protein